MEFYNLVDYSKVNDQLVARFIGNLITSNGDCTELYNSVGYHKVAY